MTRFVLALTCPKCLVTRRSEPFQEPDLSRAHLAVAFHALVPRLPANVSVRCWECGQRSPLSAYRLAIEQPRDGPGQRRAGPADPP